jgi:microcystin-dependent protein
MFTVTSNAVGIGKSNPGYPLDVVGDVNFTGTLRQNGVLYASGGGGSSQWSNTSSNVYLLSSNVAIGKSNASFPLVVGDVNFTGTLCQNGAAYVGSQWSNTSSSVFLLSSNVGIATSNSQYPLEVNGDVGIKGNLNMVNKTISLGGLVITPNSNDSANITTTITSVPGFSNESSNVLIYASSNSSSNYIRFKASNTELVRITGTGYVGIGTSNPGSHLEVNGDTNIKGNLYASNIVGLVLPFAGSSAPTGWLLCYGQAVSRTTYSNLYAVVSTNYGTGDGSTTFNLPDLRGRVVVGLDNMGGSAANRITSANSGIVGSNLGAVGGVESVTLSSNQCGIPVHNHSITDPGHSHGSTACSFGNNVGGTGLYNPTNANTISIWATPTYTSNTGITINNSTATNAAASHNNVQPSLIMNYIIKY